jgi:hypothetical protein
VHGDPRVAGQPGLHCGVFVRGVVVGDDVQLDPGVCLRDELEEVQELGVGVSLVAGVGDFPVATSSAANRLVVPWRT